MVFTGIGTITGTCEASCLMMNSVEKTSKSGEKLLTIFGRLIMKDYLIKRLLLMVPVLIGITILSFIIITLAPGDPAVMHWNYEEGPPTEEDLAAIRAKLGLDKPIFFRYLYWLVNIIKGDLGFSLISRKPVIWEIQQRIGVTVLISTMSMAISLVFGVLIGTYCAINQYKPSDYLLSVLAFLGLSTPSFWLAMMMILLFTNKLGWLPSVGLSNVYLTDLSAFEIVIDRLKHIIMPVTAMSVGTIGSWARYQRAAYLEVLNQDYIRTARSKGVDEVSITFVHALRNASLPIITVLGMSLPTIVGGSFIIESIFGLPGMGSYGITAIMNRDYTAIMGVTLMSSILVLVVMFLTDILYTIVDPRIRFD